MAWVKKSGMNANVAMMLMVVLYALASLSLGKACDVCHTTPTTPTPTTPAPRSTCPVDVAKIGVCSPLLAGALEEGAKGSDCCALLGILGLDVEVCLCLAIDVNILGLITIDAKIDVIITILTACGYTVPPNFSCPK